MEQAACRCSNKERIYDRNGPLSNPATVVIVRVSGLLIGERLHFSANLSLSDASSFIIDSTCTSLCRSCAALSVFFIFFLIYFSQKLTSFETQITEKSRLTEEDVHTDCVSWGLCNEPGVSISCQSTEFCSQ